MNLPWATIAHVVGGVAPSIATVLGGPILGPIAGPLTALAVKMLTTVLGLPADAPPMVVAQAVQDATPEQHIALRQADESFRAHAMDLAAQAMAGQVDLNKVEAGNASFFIAGARPTILWILAAGLAWGTVLDPMLSGVIGLWRPGVVLPVPDMSVILPLLVAMLGLGGLRSFDKARGTDTKGFGNAADRTAGPVPVQPMPIIVPVGTRQPAPAPPIFVQTGDAPPTVDEVSPEPIAPVVIAPTALPSRDRKPFFDAVRPLFDGHMSDSQVDGMTVILNYAATLVLPDARHLAYILATTFWETRRAMQPVEEKGHGAGHAYGATGFWGRGPPQLTGEANYIKMGTHLGIDLVSHPERMLDWDVALPATFDGMMLGMFTGKKLSDYFNATVDDPLNARRIVNGQDKAETIAEYHAVFLRGLASV